MIKWVIQKNLIKKETLEEFKCAFKELSINYEEVIVIPFSSEIPEFNPSQFNIFYGSTTLMLNVYNSPYKSGLFYNPEKFNTEMYLKHWGKYMLNADGVIQRFDDFIAVRLVSQLSWFIRPNSDDKSFAGRIMTSEEISDFYLKIQNIDNPNLNPGTLIFTAIPKQIFKEWRIFIVNNKVVDITRYALNHELAISRNDIPIILPLIRSKI